MRALNTGLARLNWYALCLYTSPLFALHIHPCFQWVTPKNLINGIDDPEATMRLYEDVNDLDSEPLFTSASLKDFTS